MISKETVGDTYNADLHLFEAVILWLAHNQSAQFGSFRDVEPDGLWDDRTPAAIRAFMNQLGVPGATTIPTAYVRFMGDVYGRDPQVLIDRVRPPDPPPPAPPDPNDEPPEPWDPPPTDPDRTGESRIVFVNRSSWTRQQLMQVRDAIQWQVDQHFAPHFGWVDVTVGEPSGPDDWPLVFVDQSTVEGAGGWHSVGGVGGDTWEPIGEVSLNSGLPPSLVASHEVLEMAPGANSTVNQFVHVGGDWFYWRETADPVQSPASGYHAPNGVLCSNFVTNAYWGDWGEVFGDYDARGWHRLGDPLLIEPLSIAPGGYMGAFNFKTGEITYLFGTKSEGRSAAQVRSVLADTDAERVTKRRHASRLFVAGAIPGAPRIHPDCRIRHAKLRMAATRPLMTGVTP